MSARTRALVILLAVVLVLPMLGLPFGHDLSMFSTGARMILDGAVYYRDVIDVKPPLLYYWYAALYGAFGDSEFVVHLADIVVQFAVAWLLYRAVRRLGDERWALAAAFTHILVYAALGFQNVAQTESVGGALAVVAFLLSLRPLRPGRAIAIGLLAGLAALFKTTLVVVLPAALLTALFVHRESWRRWSLAAAVGVAGIALVLGVHLWIVAVSGLWEQFALVQTYTREFVLLHLQPAELARALVTLMPMRLDDTLSVGIAILATVGAVWSMRRVEAQGNDRLRGLLRAASVWALVMFGSIAVEGRFHPYHFIRLIPYVALLASFVVVRWRPAPAATPRGRAVRAIGLVAVALLALLALPLPRWAWRSLPSVYRAIGDSAAYELCYSRSVFGFYNPTEQARVGAELRALGARDGELFVASGVAANVYHESGIEPSIPLLHSSFYVAPFAPKPWRDVVANAFVASPPRFVVLTDDDHADLNGTTITSAAGLRSIRPVDSILRADYRRVGGGRWFTILERGRGRLARSR